MSVIEAESCCYEEEVKVLKALADVNRFRILHQLKEGEVCACKILNNLNIGQPTLSHHMKILCEAGIVVGRKEGKWTHYSLQIEKYDWIKMILNQ